MNQAANKALEALQRHLRWEDHSDEFRDALMMSAICTNFVQDHSNPPELEGYEWVCAVVSSLVYTDFDARPDELPQVTRNVFYRIDEGVFEALAEVEPRASRDHFAIYSDGVYTIIGCRGSQTPYDWAVSGRRSTVSTARLCQVLEISAHWSSVLALPPFQGVQLAYCAA